MSFELPKEVDVILYHGSCPDGFAAAHIALKKYGRRPSGRILTSYGMLHGQPLPLDLVKDQHVLVVDFAWKREAVEQLKAAAASLTIIDHHVSAREALVGLDYAIFDMERSGASMTWDLLFPGQSRPWWVDAVEQRDLWKLKPDTLALNAYIMSVPYKHAAWANMIEGLDEATALQLGNAIRMQIEHYVEGVVEHRQSGFLGDHTVTIVNAQYLNSSDVCDALLSYADIAIYWFERGDRMVQFGLRSKGKLNVALIARALAEPLGAGHGGHVNAAGFQTTLAQGRTLLDNLRSAGHVFGEERIDEVRAAEIARLDAHAKAIGADGARA